MSEMCECGEPATKTWDEGEDYAFWTRQPRHTPVCDECWTKRDNYEPPDPDGECFRGGEALDDATSDWLDRHAHQKTAALTTEQKQTLGKIADGLRPMVRVIPDREATCSWDCTLPYPHEGPCAANPDGGDPERLKDSDDRGTPQ